MDVDVNTTGSEQSSASESVYLLIVSSQTFSTEQIQTVLNQINSSTFYSNHYFRLNLNPGHWRDMEYFLERWKIL